MYYNLYINLQNIASRSATFTLNSQQVCPFFLRFPVIAWLPLGKLTTGRNNNRFNSRFRPRYRCNCNVPY